MESIKFDGWETMFPILSIQPVATHILRIEYESVMPEESGYAKPFTLYTQGGIEEATLEGWHTVYYVDGQTVYLSDDGSVWTEPKPQAQPQADEEPEEYEPAIEDLMACKISEMESACQRTIKNGIDVDGGHFALTTEARLGMLAKQREIDSGKTEIGYHADGEPSRYYTAAEMQNIIDTANEFVDYQQTYCNDLCLWIETLTDADEINGVYYGMEIPEDNQSPVLKDMLQQDDFVAMPDEEELS